MTLSESLSAKHRHLRTLSYVSCLVFLMFMYELAFRLSMVSPLSEATWRPNVAVVVYSAAASLIIAAILTAIIVIGQQTISLLSRGAGQSEWPVLLVSGLLLAVGALSMLENFLYTIFGVGVESSENVPFELFLLVFSTSVAALVARRSLRWFKARTLRSVLLVPGGLFAILGVALISVEEPTEPPPLRSHGQAVWPNVVILSADGITAERMSIYGYNRPTTPFLAERRDEFLLFENAFTNNGNTTGSITSLLTGRSPLTTGVIFPPDQLRPHDALYTLPYLLGEEGYHRSNWAVPHYVDAHDQNLVNAFDSNNGDEVWTNIPEAWPLGVGLPRWFIFEVLDGAVDLVMDTLGLSAGENPFAQVSEDAGKSLTDSVREQAVIREIETKQRFFINTHFMSSHGPKFQIAKPHFSSSDEQHESYQKDFYDDAVLEFDARVRAVYAALERSGKLEETIVIVTSDHAMRFDASKRIPLLIRFPDAERRGAVSVNVQRLDVAPTILDFMKVAIPSWMEGQSLLRVEDIAGDRQFAAANNAGDGSQLRFGERVRAGDATVITYVRCKRYIRITETGRVSMGEIRGSTATCDEVPQVPSD